MKKKKKTDIFFFYKCVSVYSDFCMSALQTKYSRMLSWCAMVSED